MFYITLISILINQIYILYNSNNELRIFNILDSYCIVVTFVKFFKNTIPPMVYTHNFYMDFEFFSFTKIN